jgi:hypothetical protein
MVKGATISACGRYRYRLTRVWGGHGLAYWVMLNPSTADASVDDATIRKCIGFSQRYGFGGMVAYNLFAYRARDPKAMKAAVDPIGPENNRYLRELEDQTVICAWGPHGQFRDRGFEVRSMLRSLGARTKALSFTRDGHPGHPLMLSYDRPLLDF